MPLVFQALRGPRREPACIDGWMDGWMGDGRAGEVEKNHVFSRLIRKMGDFFSVYFSKTTRYMSLIVSTPPRRSLKTHFVKKSEFLTNLFFVKKFRTKRVFFEKILPFNIKKNSSFFGLKRIPIFLD